MNKGTVYILGLMTLATVAYLLFLAAAWNQYQQDRAQRDTKIDMMLERLPKPKTSDDLG